MEREKLKKELRTIMIWGEETPEYWKKEVRESGYPAVLKRLEERVSEWRAACEGEENVVKEAKILAYMKWKEVKKLVEEVLDEILEKAEKTE